MPIIVCATPKGGAGKTTTSLVLGLTLAARGAKVTLIEADDNSPLTDWYGAGGKQIEVVGDITEQSFVPLVDRHAAIKDAVIVDLRGVASRVMSRAILRANLVLVPLQPSKLDAKQAARMVELVREEEQVLGQPIPFRVVMTRTSNGVPTKATRKIMKQMQDRGIPALKHHLNERVAFRSIFELNCGLTDLDPKEVSGVAQALRNAEQFTDEVVELLRGLAQGRAAA